VPSARKIILHAPVSDDALLEPFVEQCLRDGVSLIAVFEPGAEALEETIDWIVVGDGTDPDRFLCTSAHVAEPFDDVLNMAEVWEAELGGVVQEVRL